MSHEGRPTAHNFHLRVLSRISGWPPSDVQKETVPFRPMRDDGGLNTNNETARLTPAEVTAGIILTAAQRGESLPIPGALDVRVGRRASRTSDAAQPAPFDTTRRAVSAERPPSAAPDLERREHEREGGGAPSERSAAKQKHESLFERLCHLF
jgi:hypothetical protein